jgi:hypothetical protein
MLILLKKKKKKKRGIHLHTGSFRTSMIVMARNLVLDNWSAIMRFGFNWQTPKYYLGVFLVFWI